MSDPSPAPEPTGDVPEDQLPWLAVIDLDGVVADVRHRLHHLEGGQRDWGAFFAAMAGDPLLPEGAAIVASLADAYPVLYLSGRPEHYRETTSRWLRDQGLPPGPLRLRPAGDRRPAAALKVAVLRELATGHRVAVLVDDDPTVCDAARDAGFDVLPATWMPRSESLDRAQEPEGRT